MFTVGLWRRKFCCSRLDAFLHVIGVRAELDDNSWGYLLNEINYSSEGSFQINELSSQLEKVS
jgi:hypothetical protein